MYRKSTFSILSAITLLICGCAARPEPAQTESEIRSFLAEYAHDLNAHRREAIIDRYDRRGVYMLNGGKRALRSFDSIKETYQNNWAGPSSFAWGDLSVEVISPTAAVATGIFQWQSADGGPPKPYSYTALLIKDSGHWRIRLEDESAYTP